MRIIIVSIASIVSIVRMNTAFNTAFLHQLIHHAVQKPSLKPQTASNAGVEARWLGKNSLERPEPRKNPREEPGSEVWPVLFWLCRVDIITEHGQDVQMFINDQHGRIIIRQNS